MAQEELPRDDNNPELQRLPLELAQRLDSKMNQSAIEEKTKYTIAESFHNPSKVDWYTRYPDIDGDYSVKQMNRLIACARDVSVIIFGDDPHTRKSADVLARHAYDAKLHMTSLKGKRLLESVSAIKGDADMIQTGKDLEKRLGIKR